ncbi:MAG: GlsB/YeaQ/YmgE family stress response membrane protein [Rhodobacter sp.]|nr:GlsB/YeaQ/YmgE family stress response membrane protein [Paracoccaceae bacterium]MCC0076068.1 GlsB/YeaQ/YmgE family stress response membrane protein [Rhodobacter sp.]
MGMGWIGSIIVGGFAGWFASRFMASNTGVIMNIILGIVGAAVAGFLFGFLGVNFSGILGYLIAGFVGAVILIWAGRRLF